MLKYSTGDCGIGRSIWSNYYILLAIHTYTVRKLPSRNKAVYLCQYVYILHSTGDCGIGKGRSMWSMCYLKQPHVDNIALC